MEEQRVNNADEEELAGRLLKTKEQEGEARGYSDAGWRADSLKWKGLILQYTTPQVSWAALRDACLVAGKTITLLSQAINNCLLFIVILFLCVCVCMCINMGPFVSVCVCSRVLISSIEMTPWLPGVIHIKSQLALKFGQTP